MSRAVLRAPAKLTRSLRVVGRRPDGYHFLEAEMVSIEWSDRLEVEPGDALEVVDRTPGGAGSVTAGPENLVSQALRLVGRRARVRLEKRVPPGAGLGGGSADAAAILRWAGIGADPEDLALAATLGADVPFCLTGGRALVSGIGEVVRPLPPLELGFTLLLSPFGMSTPAVYRRWDAMGGPQGPGNDLEPAALAEEPRLGRWRDAFAEATGREPRLAGSGSTWFVEEALGRLVGPFAPPEGHGPPGHVIVTRALTSLG